MKAVSIGDALAGFFRSQGMEKRLREADIVRLWREIAGETISSRTEAQKVKDGILYVKVIDAAWRNELTYLRMELRNKLNEKVGKNLLKDIRFN